MADYSQALRAWNAGKVEEARDLLAHLLKDEPLNADYLYAYARSCFVLGHRDEATQTLTTLLQVSPSHENGRILQNDLSDPLRTEGIRLGQASFKSMSAQGDTRSEGLPSNTAVSTARGLVRVRGIVKGYSSRVELRRRLTVHVVTFRLEQHDLFAHDVQLPVEIRGLTIAGQILNGDDVEVHGKLRHGVLIARTVRSHSSGGLLTSNPWKVLQLKIGRAGAVLAVVSLLALTTLTVRHVPRVWVNTPMGLGDYRDEVLATCNRIGEDLSGAMTPALSFDFTDEPDFQTEDFKPLRMIRVDRDVAVSSLSTAIGAMDADLAYLLGRPAPILLREDHKRVQKSVEASERSNQELLRALQAMPDSFSLEELLSMPYEVPGLDAATTGRSQTRVYASLSAAMSSLAASDCSFSPSGA